MFVNHLSTLDKQTEHTREDITRRLCILPSRNKCNGHGMDDIPIDMSSTIPLAQAAIRMRVEYDYKPPMTLSTLMHTLFAGNITYAFTVVDIDPEPSFLYSYCATLLLGTYFRITPEDMQKCLSSLCCEGVYKVNGAYAIAGIKPIEGASVVPLPTAEE